MPDVDGQARVAAVLRTSAFNGATAAQIAAAANIPDQLVSALMSELVTDGRAIVVARPHAYVAGEIAADLLARAIERLELRAAERPWVMGMTSIALAQALGVPEGSLVRILTADVEAGLLAYHGGYYATIDFTPRLSDDQQAFFDAVFACEPDTPDMPVPFDLLRATMRASSAPELGAAFETLLTSGAISKVGACVYCGPHIAAIRARLETTLQTKGRITVAEFRDLTGMSRKYAVPLLEYFDAVGVTIRDGDVRVLRQHSPPRR